jgi:hypothetical protein
MKYLVYTRVSGSIVLIDVALASTNEPRDDYFPIEDGRIAELWMIINIDASI